MSSKQQATNQQQQQPQLSPNHLTDTSFMDNEGHHSPSSPRATYNGSTSSTTAAAATTSPSASLCLIGTSPSISISGSSLEIGGGGGGGGGGTSGNECHSPNSTMSASSIRYRRSISFPNKIAGTSPTTSSTTPTNNYSLDVTNLNMGNGVTQTDCISIGGSSGSSVSVGGSGGVGVNVSNTNTTNLNNFINTNPYAGNGTLDLRPIDHCLNDIMRNISAVAASNDNAVVAAALVERLRNQKLNEQQQQQQTQSQQQQQQQQQQQHHHLSEVDAVTIAAAAASGGGGVSGGNNTAAAAAAAAAAAVAYLDTALKLNSPARSSPHTPVMSANPNNINMVGGVNAVVTSNTAGGGGGGSGNSVVGGGASAGGSNVEHTARYSRKVFVGGLPPDIDEDEITTSFRRFGPLVVDWPHKAESKSYFPPKGYAFLLFQDENSVQQLIDSCITDDDKLYLCVSSPTIKDKPVQIRPWRLADADYVLDATMSLDPRKTVFVGGVPRPLKAFELAMIMDRLYGGVCYAGIDTDPELKYPKGAGRVAFANQQSYIAAISARFVQLQHGDIDKRVEVKPYVLDDQMCDECEGQRCSGKFAPFFCANVTCLQYYCEHCWAVIHSRPGREYHKPLVKEGADRPRAVPFRWC